MDVRFKAPFTACLTAGTKCGKTEWAKKFVRNNVSLIEPPPEKIYWAYGEWQEGYKELEDIVIFIDGVPDLDLFREDKSTRKLLICDDLMQAYGNKHKEELTALFCKGSHHWNLSILHILQNLFFSNMRTARINSHYMILMKNPADRLQLMTLANQVFPRKQKCLIESFDDACAQPYGYLVLDLEPSTPDNLRLRTSIFPEDPCCVIYEPRV
jgi:hypothetical protein